MGFALLTEAGKVSNILAVDSSHEHILCMFLFCLTGVDMDSICQPVPAGGTCKVWCVSRCLVSGISTDPEPCKFIHPRLTVHAVPWENGILVVELSPGLVWTRQGPSSDAIHNFDPWFS